MAETKLIRDHHLLARNMQLNGNYISNDGGDEGIAVDDAGDVGINIPTTITPATKLEVFNQNVQYSAGTASQSSTVITGSGTTFTVGMVGGRFIFDDGTDAGTITAFASVTALIVSTSQTVSSGSYKIYYPSVQIDAGASSTTLKLGDVTIGTEDINLGLHGNFTVNAHEDIALSADGGNITMNDGSTTVFDFDVDDVVLKIMDDADNGDYLSIAVGASGATTITTVDNGGVGADLSFIVDGATSFTSPSSAASGIITLGGAATFINPFTKSSSGTGDASLNIQETLNLGSGEAGGSDQHNGLQYVQVQTDIAGWNNVYLMRLYGGDAARTFAVRADGKVGIGVTDPDSLLEIFGTSTQLKLSHNANDYATFTVADTGDLTIATVGDGTTDSDLTLDADGDITLDADGEFNLYTYNYAGSQADSSHDLTISTGGTTVFDKNWSNTDADTLTVTAIDFDKTGASTSNNTIYGLNIDMDNTTATDGANTMYGIYCTPTLTHAAGAGVPQVYGIYSLVTGGANGLATSYGMRLEVNASVAASDESYGIYLDNTNGGIDFINVSSETASDYFTLNTILRFLNRFILAYWKHMRSRGNLTWL